MQRKNCIIFSLQRSKNNLYYRYLCSFAWNLKRSFHDFRIYLLMVSRILKLRINYETMCCLRKAEDLN